MSESSWIVNIARGTLVDTDALVDAREAGSIGGAELDVTDPEPLPDGHRLWKLPNAITVFLRPASLDELVPRLVARGTETEAERRIRLATAEREMQRVSEYDYVIVNQRDRVDDAVGDLKAIIVAERARVCPRIVTL